MKSIFSILIGISIVTLATAQLNVEFPWNPDYDNDDFIGVTDLTALLSAFDSEFSEENIYLSSDSSIAMYDMGNRNYPNCQISCNDLPGNWKMPSLSEISVSDAMWLDTPQESLNLWGYCNCYRAQYLSSSGDLDTKRMSDNGSCYCHTKELPKVEYCYCFGAEIQECAESKVNEGWIPLGGTTTHEKTLWTSNGYDHNSINHFTQAFWRLVDY